MLVQSLLKDTAECTVALFPGSTHLTNACSTDSQGGLQMMESWVGPGNEASSVGRTCQVKT